MAEFWQESLLAKTSLAWLPAYADIAAKSAIILLAAWCLAFVFRKRAAAARHLVWALALGGVLALPVFSAALPAWRVLPGWTLTQSEAPRPPIDTLRQLPTTGGSTPRLPALDASRASLPAADDGPAVTPMARRDGPADAVSQGQDSAWKRLSMTTPAALMLLWACGMTVLLVPLVAGAIALARLSRTAHRVTDGPWALSLRAAAAQLGLRKPVKLFEGRPRSMPTVWGVFAPKLLVPAEGSSWIPERRLVVLLHELAHAKRCDCLTGLIGRIACSVYWFNPLVWFAWRKLQAESERACDDLVISTGNSAADYADHILAIVSSVQHSRLVNQAAIAMARPSNLEGRLRAILDERRSRRALTWMAVAAAAVALAAVVVPLSMMKASAGEAKRAATGSEAAITSEAPKGIVVNEKGQPIPAAEVILYYVNSLSGYGNGIVDNATTGPDGAFAMKKGLTFKSASATERGDHYLLFAKHPDYAVAWRTVVSGAPTGDCRLTMTEAATAEFLVTDGGEKPLAGAKVWIAAAGAPGEQNPFLKKGLILAEDVGIVTTMTDENGRAKLDNLPRTMCSFFASLGGYGDEWSRPFSPPAQEVRFTMKKAGTVAGRVVTEEGKPVADAAVWFDPQWGLSWRGYAVTDKDGQFKHDRLAAKGGSWVPGGGSGKYAVSVTAGEYASGMREVELEQGQTVSGFDLVAVKGTLVRVKVLDADAKTAVSGAQVSLVQAGTRLRLRGYSDKDGVVDFRLPSGEAEVSIAAPPGNEYLLISKDRPSTQTNVFAKGGIEEVTLYTQTKANKLTAVSGRLVLPDGTPATGIHLTTTNEKYHRTARWIGTGNAHATTAADGSFTLEEVPARMGLFIYGITNDLRFALAKVMLPSIERNVLKEPLVMQPTVSCDVVIADDANSPKADTALVIKPSMWGNQLIRAEDRDVSTDMNGRLKADGIVPGLEYFVRDARANMSQPNWYQFFNKTMVLAGEPDGAAPAASAKATKATPDDLTKAVENGTLKRLVTTPEEFKELYGKPLRENSEQKGDGVEVVFLAYDGFGAAFQRFHADEPFGLFALSFGQGWRELGAKGLLGGDRPAAVPDNLRKAIEDGTLKHLVTTVDEFKERFGKPRKEVTDQRGGGVEVLFVTYNDFSAAFQKDGANESFRLFAFNFGEGWRDLGAKDLLEAERPKEAKPAGETADDEKTSSATAAAVQKAVADGTLKRLETTADEFRQLFGKPTMENTEDKAGTTQALFLAYDGVSAAFAGDSSTKEPFRLFALNFGQGWRQLGEKRLEETEERGFMKVRPVDSVNEYDDVCWKDMSKLDLSGRIGLPETLQFNEATVWPPSEKLPPGCDPKAIVEKGKNPGLGVRALHGRGVTGKGVSVAIIDQPLYQDHPEFAGKIAAYFDTGCQSDSSMHGPSVASLLVGTDCGTAPGATLYYAAAPSWKADAEYYAKALDWIVQQNEKLPAGGKIRVVSVSAAPSGPGSPFTANNDMWDEACERAEKAGILILTCEQTRGFVGPCWYDAQDPESVAKCRPGFAGMETGFWSGCILAPCSVRTTAEEYQKGGFSYAYWGRGGLSWSIPYAAGVLAMGWQTRPDLPADWMRWLLYDSAHKLADGSRVIDPAEFIKRVKDAKVAPGDNPPAMPKRQVTGGGRDDLMKVKPVASVKSNDDVRRKDMSKLDLSGDASLLTSLKFNSKTVWPGPSKLPAGFDPKALMEAGKNPGLGIRALHKEGIIGKGVRVAIIGQPVLQDHPEFAGKFAGYHDCGVGAGSAPSSMTGPVLASALVGTDCGTAPGARLYYVQVPEWKGDAKFSADALDWIVKQNASLPAGDRIRVVAVGAPPDSSWFKQNTEMWPGALKRAEAAGILVLQDGKDFYECLYGDDRESVENCRVLAPGWPGRMSSLLVPVSPKTAAEEYVKGEFAYQHLGGMWGFGATAYTAGVLAMGWQVRPELSADEMKELLVKSAYAREDGWKIINPKEFIRLVREAKPASTAEEERAASGDPRERSR